MKWGRVTYPFFLKCLKTQLNYLKMNARKITNPSQALEFLQGGNATATFVGQSSRYTYKIRKADKGDMYFVSLLVGANNESDYLYIGCISTNEAFSKLPRVATKVLHRLWLLALFIADCLMG